MSDILPKILAPEMTARRRVLYMGFSRFNCLMMPAGARSHA